MTQITLIQQTKLDFYNISVQDKPHSDCSQTIDIGIDFEDINHYDRMYVVQQLHGIIDKMQDRHQGTTQTISEDIYEINIFREDTTIDNHIKFVEEFIEYCEELNIEYLTAIIRI